ncbi:hypothetical protein ACJZ2D_004834 [Fusarium nematophilum]
MYIRRGDASHAATASSSLDGESRSAEIIVILTVFSALSTIVVALRTWTRLALLRTFGYDDGMMVIAQVLVIGTGVAIGFEGKYGLGHHTWVQPKEYFIPYMKSFYSSIVLYNLAMCCVKIAILLQYRRVFAVRMMQRITLFAVAFMGVWTITITFLNILPCIPVQKFWDHTVSGRCLNSPLVWYIMAGFNLVTDLVIFCLPLPVIRGLHLPRKQKAMLFAVFCLGFFTCIISIIRIRTLKAAGATDDPNWDNVGAATWSFLEVCTAVIAACLPTLRPIFSKIMPRVFGSSVERSYGRSRYGPYVRTRSSNQLRSKAGKKSVGISDSTRSLHDGSESVELPTRGFQPVAPPAASVSVKITVGEKRDRAESQLSEGSHSDGKGGIQTTTVVMQRVAVEKKEGGRDQNRRREK